MSNHRKLNIALISPRTGMYRYGTGVFSMSLRYAPLNMLTLASLVPEALRGEVRIYDKRVKKIDPAAIDADIVGLTGITGVSMRSYAYAHHFRSRGITTIMGGPHATLMPREAKQHVDSVVIGHAYESWPQALFDFSNNQLQPFYHPPSKIDFSKIPTIDRSSFKGKRFITLNSTQAVFGCPHHCEFCVTPVVCRGMYEHRPIADVVMEVASMQGKYVTFLDPSPVENADYSIALCKALAPLKKRWGGLATTRIVDNKKLLDAFEASGCFGLLLGFESLSPHSNSAIGKGFNNVSNYRRLVRELHARNIAVMGCFVHGIDTDTADCFSQTLDFINDVNIDLPRFTICTPFPGTPYFEGLKKQGRILTENWTLYDAQHVVFKPHAMSVDELQQGHIKCWESAYSLPGITKRLSCSRTFLEYMILANIGYRSYARGHHRFSSTTMAEDYKL